MDLTLNDILHLTDEEINNSKIGLNVYWGGKSHFETWYESDEKGVSQILCKHGFPSIQI